MALNPIHSSPGRTCASSSSPSKAHSHSLSNLPSKRTFRLKETPARELLCLEWSQPPRNFLLVKKDCSDATTDALLDFIRHVSSTYPDVNIVVEPRVSAGIGDELLGRHFTLPEAAHSHSQYQDKVDLVVTFGGDGTILHAASLFATSSHVPPILSFSMGTLGFLSEWKFSEYKRAIREVYMSGAASERHAVIENEPCNDLDCSNDYTGWSSVRGKSMGPGRGARVLVRQRLKVGVFDADGNRLGSNGGVSDDMYAMNEVIIHRGQNPHLAIVNVYVGGRFLTEAVADGMIVSTPTGSTAYSLSSGGSIVHPLVPSLLLTPICPRSLSFRPLVLPATTPITLKLSDKNRGRDVDVSIDGMRRTQGIGVGTEVRVSGEEITTDSGAFTGGIPCIMRTTSAGADKDDGWVGGLNGLLKFNYPFGEEK
ncbi:NAD+ kinase [Cladophialophora psammophila CBS 110553]|uniref:NAD+ kinase n=1 Tax=Cladophialophora psammophila CBS 110553 TaxID=1182543 RepID=W9X524_9EURO|nr:NAD+ kinase [Cladophialophora psammophila CBS 110553]EXJ75607.1 NAD+ kinase [Cladophialophora psammophila CBS 110553]